MGRDAEGSKVKDRGIFMGDHIPYMLDYHIDKLLSELLGCGLLLKYIVSIKKIAKNSIRENTALNIPFILIF